MQLCRHPGISMGPTAAAATSRSYFGLDVVASACRNCSRLGGSCGRLELCQATLLWWWELEGSHAGAHWLRVMRFPSQVLQAPACSIWGGQQTDRQADGKGSRQTKPIKPSYCLSFWAFISPILLLLFFFFIVVFNIYSCCSI